MNKRPTLQAFLIFTITAILSTYFLFRYYFQILEFQKITHYLTVLGSRLGIVLGIFLLFLVVIWFLYRRFRSKIPSIETLSSNNHFKWIISFCLILFTIMLWYFQLNRNLDVIYKIIVLFMAFWLTFWFMYLISKMLVKNSIFVFYIASALLFTGVVFSIFTYIDKVSVYPFSMDWSEGNRYFNAELIVTWIKSGFTSPLPILHPTRYLLQAVPFIFSRNIFVARLWQAFLWIAVTYYISYLIIKRVGIRTRYPGFLLLLYCYLFLQQGPIYYHLLISIVPILIWFNPKKLWQSAIVIIISSIWAALSRLNWYFMPISVCIFLILFEVETNKLFTRKAIINYFVWGGFALVSIILTKYMYQTYSGNPAEYFDTAFTSSLLWYRLFPNSTFLPGVLLGIIIALAPLLLWVQVFIKPKSVRNLKSIAIALILAIYFMGSLIVSVKIGGGSNLHNFDSFLVLFLLAIVFLLKEPINNFTLEDYSQNPKKLGGLVICTVLIPLLLIVFSSNSLLRYRDPDHSAEIPRIQEFIDNVDSNEEIMCISQCQLFTFGQLHASKVEGKYEKILLMEMAMANNEVYLSEFRDDIRNQRFPLIISEHLETQMETINNTFGDENNYWVQQVSNTILEYYSPLQYFKNTNIEVLIPKR